MNEGEIVFGSRNNYAYVTDCVMIMASEENEVSLAKVLKAASDTAHLLALSLRRACEGNACMFEDI